MPAHPTATPPPAPCWVPGAAGSGHDVDHLPLGVGAVGAGEPGPVVRIGDHALPLPPIAAAHLPRLAGVLDAGVLNPFLAAGPAAWTQLRETLVELLTDERHRARVEPMLVPVADLSMVLPVEVADYVDFYASLDHATNVGRMFRPDGDDVLPNWRHLPVGYHGRSGTVVVSGTDVRRPRGQRPPRAGEPGPTYGPSRRLDLEAEVAHVVGAPSEPGHPVPADALAGHVFGVALLNDWSARDVQGWEYQPLGPFLGKSFATSLAAWVTPLAALEAARCPLPGQDPAPLEHLRVTEPAGYDLELEVLLDGEVVARPPHRTTYWSPGQMLAHLTSNGAPVRTGELFASGTVSGPERGQRGSLLELSWGGQEPFLLRGRERTWLEDGDVVTIRASAPGALGGRLALGEVTGRVLPAR